MNDGSPNIPQAISPDVLVYQNRQLIRLVRQLRKQGEALGKAEGIASFNERLFDEVDALKVERLALYARLEGLKRTVQGSLDTGSTQIEPTVSESSTSCVPHEQQDSDQLALASDLLCSLKNELTRLATALAITSSAIQGATKEATAEIELFNLNSDRSLWIQKTNSSNKKLEDVLKQVDSISKRLDATCCLTEKTFIIEIERLAGELAGRHNELRKCQATIAELELRMRSTTSEKGPNFYQTGVAQSDTSARMSEQLRIKEEQCTRLLTQHVQLQHRVSGLEQEIAILQNRDRSVENLIKCTNEDLAGSRSRETKQAELMQAMYEESEKEGELRLSLQTELMQARKDFKMLEELNNSLRMTIEVLQAEFQQALTTVGDQKRIKSAGAAKPGVASSSLLQMELDELKERVKCPLCLIRSKTVTLSTCMHCFCRECVDEKMLNARNRKCPLCMQRFADSDVRRLM